MHQVGHLLRVLFTRPLHTCISDFFNYTKICSIFLSCNYFYIPWNVFIFSHCLFSNIRRICNGIYKIHTYNQSQFTHTKWQKQWLLLSLYLKFYFWIGSHSSSILNFSLFILCILPPRRSSHSWPKHVCMDNCVYYLRSIYSCTYWWYSYCYM